MKLIILKNHLSQALYIVERAVGSNTNLSILKNILIKTEHGKISITATNLELAITTTVSGKVIEEGETTVPFIIFNTIIKNITSERVSLEEKEHNLLITTDNYEAKIQTQHTKEFPIIPKIQNPQGPISIPTEYLKSVLGNVVLATQISDIRPEIGGVFLRCAENKVVLVATDSFRLAEHLLDEKQVVVKNIDEIGIIIPLRTAEEFLKILNPDNGNAEIFFDANQILLQTNSTSLISRLIDGTFPEYHAIIPKQISHEISINRQEFLSAIKLVSAFSGKTNDVRLAVGENKKFLELYSADSAVGENNYRIPIKLKGEKFSVVFNWRYLADGLKMYQGEEITFGVNTPDRPALMRGTGEPLLTYVIMPIKE